MKRLSLALALTIATMPMLISCASEKKEVSCCKQHEVKEFEKSHRKGDKKSFEKFLFKHTELNLTEAQKEEIKTISQQLKSRSREIRKEMKINIKNLDSIMVGGVFSEEAFKAITDTMEKQKAMLVENRHELFLKVYRILDESQREKFLPLFRDKMFKGERHFKFKHKKMDCVGCDDCSSIKQNGKKDKTR